MKKNYKVVISLAIVIAIFCAFTVVAYAASSASVHLYKNQLSATSDSIGLSEGAGVTGYNYTESWYDVYFVTQYAPAGSGWSNVASARVNQGDYYDHGWGVTGEGVNWRIRLNPAGLFANCEAKATISE